MESRNRVESSRFFHLRLLYSNPEEIHNYLQELDQDAEAIKKELRMLSWYSNNALTYYDAMQLSQVDRREWISFINDQHDKESGTDKFRQELI